MSKKKLILNERLAIRDADDLVSSAWWLKVTKDSQVYLGTTALGRIIKYSFHTSPDSRICRYAVASAEPRKPLHEWRRSETPPAGKGHATRAALIAFPSDYLSLNATLRDKPPRWIPAAPPGGATYLEFIYTRESQTTLAELLAGSCYTVFASAELESEETFAVLYYHDRWKNEDLRVPARSGAPEYLFTASDVRDTGRPVRIVIANQPKDGDAIILYELGGYPVDPNLPDPIYPLATFERREWKRGRL